MSEAGPAIRGSTFQFKLQGDQVTMVAASPDVYDLLGYRAEELLSGQLVLPSLVHADDGDIVALLFRPVGAPGAGEYNLRVRQANGRILCVKALYRHEVSADGTLLDLVLQDAKSLPRTMPYATAQSHAAAVMDNTDDYVYFKDRNHVFIGASQTLVALCEPAEHWTDLLGKTDYDVFPEESADRFYRLEKQVFATGVRADEVQETISKDGKKGWVDNRKYPIRDADGAIIGLHGIARDITESRRTEAELLEREARARAILEASPVPMAVNDDGLRITFLNPAFTETFGYDRSDIPTLHEWWPKAYPDPVYREQVGAAWERELSRSKMEGTPFVPMEITIRCKDGTDRVALVRAAALGESFAGDHLVVIQDVTAFKQAERALQASEERWRFAVEGSGDGAWDWDLRTGAVNYSKRWKEILGYEEHEIAPSLDSWRQLAHPDDAERVLADVQSHFEGRTSSSSNEYRMRCKDGSWKWILGRGLVVARDEAGVALRMIGTISDISGRKQAELDLRRSKETLDEAQRISHLGSWELDAATNDIVMSDELYRIYGFDPALPSPSLAAHEALYTPAGWNTLQTALARALKTGKSYEIEIERRMPNGSQGWLWARGEAITDSAGVTVGLRGVAQDITERKRADAAARLSDVVIRSISQGVIVTGPDRRIVSVNDAFCAMTGYQAHEVLGRDYKFLVGPLTDHNTIETIRTALRRNAGFSGEIQNHRKDGTPFWNDLTITPVMDSAGVLTHFIGVTRDVTSRKQMEQEHADIEMRLRQAQRLETVGTLAAGIAHDFNNILAAVVGNAELALNDTEVAHPAREHLVEIERASMRARTLVQQVLAFSKPQPQSRHSLELGPLVMEATALLRATIPTSVQLVTSIDADTPTVLGDASQMHQVLVNLCTNAWHALDGRPGRIEVQLGPVQLSAAEALEVGLSEGRYVCLSVRDNGKGMDAATRRRMFDPFFTTKGPGKGTGLGLSVVHGIVTSHQGGIRVVSEPGQGANFCLYFPAAGLAPSLSAPATAEAPTSPDAGVRILCLDDEEILVRVFTRILERLGHRVSGFVRPEEALLAFRKDPARFDVVFTDMNMPGATGLAIAEELRKVRADIPIVLVSGSVDEALREAAKAVGIVGILAKPFTTQELTETIAQLTLHAREA